jgi:hypothetical protein
MQPDEGAEVGVGMGSGKTEGVEFVQKQARFTLSRIKNRKTWRSSPGIAVWRPTFPR